MRLLVGILLLYLLYTGVQWIMKTYWAKELHVRVYCSGDYAYEGEKLELIEEITNRKPMPLPGLKVKFTTSRFWAFDGEEPGDTTDQYYRSDVFSVGMNERIRRSYPFTCRKRGYYVLGDVDVFASDYFYTREYVQRQKNQQWIYVFARKVKSPQVTECFRYLLGEVQTRRRLHEDSFTFSGIRDYQSYDSIRRMNWNATAKTGELKVNCYDYTAEQSVHILLFFEQKNVDWDKNMEEYVISLAGTLAEEFLQRKVSVAVTSNGLDVENGKPVMVGMGAGENHLRSIHEGMARIDLEQRERSLQEDESFLRDAMQKDDFYILLTTSQSSRLQKVLLEKQGKAVDFQWILPHYEMEQVKIEPGLQERMLDLVTELE